MAVTSPDPLTPEDAAALRMMAGAHFGPEANLTLPSGRRLSPAEAQALTSAYAPPTSPAGPFPPPPPGYRPPPPPAPPKKKGMPTWAIVLIVLGAVVVLACGGLTLVAGVMGKGISDMQNAANKDVRITSCSADGGQFDFVGPKATVEVTNHGKQRASYSVTVAFETSGGSTQLGTGVAFVNNLEPGQTGTGDASSFKGGSGASSFNCRITNVTRI